MTWWRSVLVLGTVLVVGTVAAMIVAGCGSGASGTSSGDGTDTTTTDGGDGSGAAASGDDGGVGTAGEGATGDVATGDGGTPGGPGDGTGADGTGGDGTSGTGVAVVEWKTPCSVAQVEFQMVDLGDVTLHVACQGSGESGTIVLLHGFPEFWLAWDRVMAPLAQAGFRVIVPDQRGYNLSDKPPEIEDYAIPGLMGDIVALTQAVSDDKVLLVGHDWGGVVAWSLGALLPDSFSQLVIVNGPHPNVFARELADNPDQKAASGYIELLLGEGSELALAAQDFAVLAQGFAGVIDEEELAKYKEAWGQEDALRSMVHWYRANFGDDGLGASGVDINVKTLETLVIWGMTDSALLPGNILGLDEYVTDLRIKEYADAGHWINLTHGAQIAADIIAFANGETVGDIPQPWEPEDPVDPVDPPDDPVELPEGLFGTEASGKGLPDSFEGMTDEEKTPIEADDFLGHWTVLWFYPKANTSG